MSNWTTWGAPIIATVVGGGIASVSTVLFSRRTSKAVRHRALVALHGELKFIWGTKEPFAGHADVLFPSDAFEGAKGYLADLPEYLCQIIYEAERKIARYNAIASYVNERRPAGEGRESPAVVEALKDVEGYAGTAWGQLSGIPQDWRTR